MKRLDPPCQNRHYAAPQSRAATEKQSKKRLSIHPSGRREAGIPFPICSPHLGMVMSLRKVGWKREEGREGENKIFNH